MNAMKFIIAAGILLAASSVSAQYIEFETLKGETSEAQPTRAEVKPTSVIMPIGPAGEVACTMDAKMCPDGTYVGRVAPKCDFAPCPSAGETVKQNPLYTGPKTEPVNPLAEPKGSVAQPGTGASAGGVNIATGDVNGDGTEDVVHDSSRGFDTGLATSSPLTPDFGILLGGGGEESAAGAFIKFEGVEGETSEGAEASKGKEIRKNITIRLKAEELRTAGEEERERIRAVAPKEPEDVKDADGLALFLLSEAETTPGVRTVALSDETLEIETTATGKLFGLFSIEFPSTIVVSPGKEGEDPSVDIDLPWYAFLVNEDVDQGDLQEAAAKEKKKPKPTSSIDVLAFSFGANQAGMYRAISNVLKTKHDTVKNSISNTR